MESRLFEREGKAKVIAEYALSGHRALDKMMNDECRMMTVLLPASGLVGA